MNNLLLTLDVMKELYSTIIKTTECMFCNKEKKTFAHLITCDVLETEWKNTIYTSLLKTKKKIEKVWKIHALTNHIKRKLLNDKTNILTKRKNMRAITKDFI